MHRLGYGRVTANGEEFARMLSEYLRGMGRSDERVMMSGRGQRLNLVL